MRVTVHMSRFLTQQASVDVYRRAENAIVLILYFSAASGHMKISHVFVTCNLYEKTYVSVLH